MSNLGVALIYLIPISGTLLLSVSMMMIYFEHLLADKQRLATEDELTGTLNRRELVRCGEEALAQMRGSGAVALARSTADPATDVMSGLVQLAGRTAAVMAGDHWVTLATVTSAGVLDLPLRLTAASVGLDPGTEVAMLPPSPAARNGITLMQPKKIARVGVGVEAALTLLVDGQDKGPRRKRAPYVPSQLEAAVSGNIRANARGAGLRLQTVVTQDRPAPLTILSISRDVVF